MSRHWRLPAVSVMVLLAGLAPSAPASAQTVVGNGRSNIEVDFGVLDRLGPQPNLPAMLGGRATEPPPAALAPQPTPRAAASGRVTLVAPPALRQAPPQAPAKPAAHAAAIHKPDTKRAVKTAHAAAPKPAVETPGWPKVSAKTAEAARAAAQPPMAQPPMAAAPVAPTPPTPPQAAPVPTAPPPVAPVVAAAPKAPPAPAKIEAPKMAAAPAFAPVPIYQPPPPPVAPPAPPTAAAPVAPQPAATPPAKPVQPVQPPQMAAIPAPVAPQPALTAPAQMNPAVAAPAKPTPPPVAAVAPPPPEPPKLAAPAPAAAPAPQQMASLPSASAGADKVTIPFEVDGARLPDSASRALAELADRMNKDPNLSLQLLAYAQGDEAAASKARRLSLSRALAVRSYLIDQGVRSHRIEVRALGNKVPEGQADRVDVLIGQKS